MKLYRSVVRQVRNIIRKTYGFVKRRKLMNRKNYDVDAEIRRLDTVRFNKEIGNY